MGITIKPTAGNVVLIQDESGNTVTDGVIIRIKDPDIIDTVRPELEITRFVHDRTVIEDTESSIDLVEKGWTLFNYPERLSYF